MNEMRVVTILSGGLDSTVLLYKLQNEGFSVYALSFDYGQRHSKELGYAQDNCGRLGIPHYTVDTTSLQTLLRSSLTFGSEVPEGHYAAESMKQTVVPNRNAIMLSMAYGYAISVGAARVYFGAHAGDHAIYPDCRPSFVNLLNDAFQAGNKWADPIPELQAPFLNVTKADIVSLGAQLKVPFDNTWTCYKGGSVHCGKCGTCVERLEAFALAGVEDPTQYEDREFWKGITQ